MRYRRPVRGNRRPDRDRLQRWQGSQDHCPHGLRQGEGRRNARAQVSALIIFGYAHCENKRI